MTNTLPGKMAFINNLKKKDSRLETIKDTFSTRTVAIWADINFQDNLHSLGFLRQNFMEQFFNT